MTKQISQKMVSTSNRVFAFLLTTLTLTVVLSSETQGQTRAGSAYLKIPPGTRQQSLGASLTGALDDAYLFYANPAAAGFMREWQLSASYTEWFADIYNASIMYGRHLNLRTPWSRVVTLALGVNYQGVRDFDFTRGAQPSASAGDLLVNVGLGIPFGQVNRYFSLGGNFKYLRTELDQNADDTFVFDFGGMFRTPKYLISERGWFQYLIFSGGASYSQIGKALNFINTETPLPQTFRAGLALNLGRHDGLQLQLSADYRDVKDEDGIFGLGAQLTNLIGRSLSVRGGYNFSDSRNTELLSKYSIGLSFQLDDYQNPERFANRERHTLLSSPKNTALQLDWGYLRGELLGDVHGGTASWHSIRPEAFGFAGLDSSQSLFADSDTSVAPYAPADTIRLVWEASRDPDLYDDVNYLLFLTKDERRTQMERLVQLAQSDSVDVFQFHDVPRSLPDSTLITVVGMEPIRLASNNGHVMNDIDRFRLTDSTDVRIKKNLNQLYFEIPPGQLTQGGYYWTTVAYDINRHTRFIKTRGSHIAHFRIKEPLRPDPTIQITMIDSLLQPVQIRPDSIFDFPTGVTEVSPQQDTLKLNRWASTIKQNPDIVFKVAGFADTTGTWTPLSERKRQNLRISKERAEGVRQFLINKGIRPDRLLSEGLGENDLFANLARNRRVELRVFQDNRAPQSKCFARVSFENIGETDARGGLSVSVYSDSVNFNKQNFQLASASANPRLSNHFRLTDLGNLPPSLSSAPPARFFFDVLPLDRASSFLIELDGSSNYLVAEIEMEQAFLDIDATNNKARKFKYDLKVSQRPNAFIVQEGDVVTDKITITNSSDLTARHYTVQYTVDSLHFEPISSDPPWVRTSRNRLFWDFTDNDALTAGETRVISIQGTIANVPIDSRVDIENTAAVMGACDFDLTSNEAKSTFLARRINFTHNTCDLDDETKSFLRELAQTMHSDTVRYVIEGFTDTTGPDTYNQSLSCARAKAVKQFLIGQGIAPARLITIGWGETRSKLRVPTANNVNERRNRRVTIRQFERGDPSSDCECGRSFQTCGC